MEMQRNVGKQERETTVSPFSHSKVQKAQNLCFENLTNYQNQVEKWREEKENKGEFPKTSHLRISQDQSSLRICANVAKHVVNTERARGIQMIQVILLLLVFSLQYKLFRSLDGEMDTQPRIPYTETIQMCTKLKTECLLEKGSPVSGALGWILAHALSPQQAPSCSAESAQPYTSEQVVG